MIITSLIISGLGAVAIVGAFATFRKKLVGSSTNESDQLQAEIDTLQSELGEIIKFAPAYVSKKQLTAVETQLSEETNNLTKEKALLKEVETKLQTAQKMVEEKEVQQQDLKASKELDEQKLQDLMAAYQGISDDSMALEKKLAQSLKNLETIIAEVKMTELQKAVFTELLGGLTDGSARLRDLVIEYQNVNDRLVTLQQQHQDLEEEYTRLVEQQLGE